MKRTKNSKIAIVGAGPTGLSLAHYISKYTDYSITVFDREAEIGGCHRVRRVDDKFTEHGPRVYSSNYLNFKRILNEIGTDFKNHFVVYNFTILGMSLETIREFSFRELFLLMLQFFGLFFQKNLESVLDFCLRNNFSEKAKGHLDRLCRLTDGAGIERYTVFELMQLPNQHVFYKIYQPNEPNDEKGSWLSIWKYYLESKNVKFRLNQKIESIEELENFDKIFFAVPPASFSPLFNNVVFSEFSKETDYIVYIPITFHYSQKFDLQSIRGVVENDWGVIWVVLSDYFEGSPGVLISAAISKTDSISKTTGKTANESTREELKIETFRQIKETLTNLPDPEVSLISPGVYFEDEIYKTVDNAFVLSSTVSKKYYPPKINDRIYTVGTHNGNSYNYFTTLESAVSNGLSLVHDLFPESKKEKVLKPFQLTDLIRFIFIILVLIVVYKSLN